MSNQSLAGKTALITGGARRVGAAIARELHAAGANVAIHYRKSANDAESLAAELNTSRPRSAVTVQADLLEIAKLPGLVEFTVRSFGIDSCAVVSVEDEMVTARSDRSG